MARIKRDGIDTDSDTDADPVQGALLSAPERRDPGANA